MWALRAHRCVKHLVTRSSTDVYLRLDTSSCKTTFSPSQRNCNLNREGILQIPGENLWVKEAHSLGDSQGSPVLARRTIGEQAEKRPRETANGGEELEVLTTELSIS